MPMWQTAQRKLKQYQKKYWSAVEVVLPEARRFCDDISEQIPWVYIERKSECSLEEFCRDLFESEEVNEPKIGKCVGDLKTLITETAMRIVQADRARDILWDNIKRELSIDKDAVKFGIEIPVELKRIESR